MRMRTHAHAHGCTCTRVHMHTHMLTNSSLTAHASNEPPPCHPRMCMHRAASAHAQCTCAQCTRAQCTRTQCTRTRCTCTQCTCSVHMHSVHAQCALGAALVASPLLLTYHFSPGTAPLWGFRVFFQNSGRPSSRNCCFVNSRSTFRWWLSMRYCRSSVAESSPSNEDFIAEARLRESAARSAATGCDE